jgi:hypothetical protein
MPPFVAILLPFCQSAAPPPRAEQPLPVLQKAPFSPGQLAARLYPIVGIFLLANLLLLAVYGIRRYRRPPRAGYAPVPVSRLEFDLESASAAVPR